MADKQCSRCAAVKPLECFRVDARRGQHRTRCKKCENAVRDRTGQYQRMTPEQRKSQNQRIAQRRKATRPWVTNPKERANRLAQKVRYRQRRAAALGKTYTPKPSGHVPRYVGPTWEQNARQAWDWWMANAPAWWIRAYYRATGKPWNSPLLTSSEKWRVRYWCDPSFRAREIEKVQRVKTKRAAQIDATSDGSLTGAVIVQMFAEAKNCHYCGKAMRSVEKSLDLSLIHI